VNQRIKPDRRFRSESRVEEIMANEPLFIDANTFAMKSTMFAMLDNRIAVVSLRASLSHSSCKHLSEHFSQNI
jgi:hypothetical protein